MNGLPGTWRRRLAVAGLCLATFLLGGCVYLRLLALKHQLADFDRNFALQTQEGLRLTCLDPVLLTGDLHWLGVFPETITRQKHSEQWHVHWVKQISSAADEPKPAANDLELELDFAENKFVGFFLAERYFAYIPKPFVVRILRGLGTAGIDPGKRRISANLAPTSSNPADSRPTFDSLAALLGKPTEQHAEGPCTLQRYRYLPPTPDSNNGDFDLLLTYVTGTGELLRLDARSSVGKLSLNFGATAPASPFPSAR